MFLLATTFLAHALVPSPSEARLLELVNGIRQAHKQEPLELSAPLCQVADGHAKFMSTNNVLSHNQRPDWPGFTGADLAERAEKVHWNDALSELVGYANSGLEDTVGAIFDSPCHRVRFLKPGKLSLGAAAEGQFVCLLVGGEPAAGVALSPPDGARDVPLSWSSSADFSGTKTGKGSVLNGYPIVLVDTTLGDQEFTVAKSSLIGESEPVPHQARSTANDAHYTNSCALIPTSPLKPNTRYRVSISLVRADKKAVTVAWSFVTKSQ